MICNRNMSYVMISHKYRYNEASTLATCLFKETGRSVRDRPVSVRGQSRPSRVAVHGRSNPAFGLNLE